MTIRSQLAWHWRWAINAVVLVSVALGVWWLVNATQRLTGFDLDGARTRIEALESDNQRLSRELDATRSALAERERQVAIGTAAQGELARGLAQLQDENASLKEDLGFLRNLMSSGSAPAGLTIANLKVERQGDSRDYRYRLLLSQGGDRRQDFRGRLQLVLRLDGPGGARSLTVPDSEAGEAAGRVEFRFYQAVEGRFRIPEQTVLRGYEVRVVALPGGQVKLSQNVNLP
jgi:hypothetical protein